MKKLTVGILAHVDAGKTTLSEAILYLGGVIRTTGRVDNGDTFLDTYELERARGITIFSKQAEFEWKNVKITLLDTPGHVDFSVEMERTLSVIDYAVLLISAADGVQGHTETLWKLLKKYKKPVFIFVNKMDQPQADKTSLMEHLKKQLSENCMDFSEDFMENAALCDERLMEQYLEKGAFDIELLNQAVYERKVFPCYFGSALKIEGVKEFLDGFSIYTITKEYEKEFGAKVYKISRDSDNNRLTHMKITGGSLNVKDLIDSIDEKVNQIRIYSGSRFTSVPSVSAGDICVVTGLTKSYAGAGLGAEKASDRIVLEPVMTYKVITGDEVNATELYKKLLKLEEEMPELGVSWNEKDKSIQIKIMGEVQIEILKNIIKERFDTCVGFTTGTIIYKESIKNTVEGIGHFEPLKHYAEVHLILSPAERGSGISVYSQCSEDELAGNWQRLIMTHIEEKIHIGVLTGSPVTDMCIILAGGRAHKKHTEGGDFRQAVYRAVRQGLMQAESVLLEPYYDFTLSVPALMVGRAMTDLERMGAHFEIPQNNGETAQILGDVSVAAIQNYAIDVAAYTKGKGRLTCRFKGYYECHNTQEAVETIGYDAEADIENTPDSVFCAHGAGYVVPWYEVQNHMHIESKLRQKSDDENADNAEEWENEGNRIRAMQKMSERNAQEDKRSGYEKDKELEEIFLRTFGSKHDVTKKERRELLQNTKKAAADKPYVYKPRARKEQYLLVDGYNIIFAWEELRRLADGNLDAARDRLLDILSNYQGYKKVNLMVVFDAYKVKGFTGERNRYNNICVVFTKEAETADQYIEKFAHNNSSKFDITVATSDGLEQIIITGEGCSLLSAREFKEEIDRVNEHIREHINERIKENIGEHIEI